MGFEHGRGGGGSMGTIGMCASMLGSSFTRGILPLLMGWTWYYHMGWGFMGWDEVSWDEIRQGAQP